MANFTDAEIQREWNSASTEGSADTTKWRKDPCGAWINRDEYGNRNSDYGWEIDHAYPESKGGDESAANLRAMHWENNQSKADDYPTYTYVKTSEGNKNVTVNGKKTVNDTAQASAKQLYKIK